MVTGNTTGNTVDYYTSDGALRKYENAAEQGLTERERRIVREYFTISGARVLDLGCGAGRTTGALSDAGFEVVGLDLSEPLVRTAAERFPNADFQVGDASNLGLRDRSFEYVLFSWNGMSELPEEPRRAALDEVNRVLKPDGVFAFSNFNSVCYYFLRGVRYPLETVEFWVRNVRAGRALSKYKLRKRRPEGDDDWIGENYFVDPVRQRRQLREHGFEVVETLGDGRLLQYVHPQPYYVSKKSSER